MELEDESWADGAELVKVEEVDDEVREELVVLEFNDDVVVVTEVCVKNSPAPAITKMTTIIAITSTTRPMARRIFNFCQSCVPSSIYLTF